MRFLPLFNCCAALLAVWSPAAMSSSTTVCESQANILASFVKLRDGGVSKEAVEAAITSDRDASLIRKLGELRALHDVYATPSITPESAYKNFKAQCMAR